MAIKKSELYSSLWESCNELRGGMDASQYKDYVLTMLFVKYVSDKYAGDPYSLIEVPEGASFEDMVKLKGQTDIGDRINKEILRPLFAANELEGSMEIADFNDDDKLGEGKEKVDRLSKLIAIFETPALNFKDNRAEDDDILGDAYEFLMRHFATESGKSKGQFYTPSEVSRILSKVIDVDKADKPSYTAYDPTCGSGSLLLKVADEAPNGLSLYGQEKDIATKGLAIMNMWLHGYAAEAKIAGKNSISDPQFKENDKLKRFDFVVANPPFSVKSWSNGIVPMDDQYRRFQGFGVPPDKNGDYAFLLHIIASLKSTGKAAVILPHGVLFRGNAEAEIRQNILERKWIKGIIGLPANLFYGTGIPACIIVIDKENAEERKGVFMIDASKGFIKDGNKNRLREQDIHKIVDAFNRQWEIDKFSRFVSFEEIEKNEFNLNIPRYIDTQEKEDIQDLNAHLSGGIPKADIDELSEYWTVYPTMRKELFQPLREGYMKLSVPKEEVKAHILNHSDFVSYNEKINLIFNEFKSDNLKRLHSINKQTKPKQFIHELSEDLLLKYAEKPLINRYEVYQHIMNYWAETLKDDVYILIEDGWVAKTRRIIEKGKTGKEKDKGWTCDLIPKALVINRYVKDEKDKLTSLETELEQVEADLSSLEEEHSAEEAAFGELDKINKTEVNNLIKTLKKEEKQMPLAAEPSEEYDTENANPLAIAEKWIKLYTKKLQLKKDIKVQEKTLDHKTFEHYAKLTEDEVRQLVIEDKWMSRLQTDIQSEIDAISQRLTGRIKELAERYAHTLDELDQENKTLEDKVSKHLKKMGLVWS
ncbi:type I restriction-modification system subunit M [Psychroflexus maritimus]|uniref:site-specific DNA-methyltransferase (adenine-specific) n=1 Tax=Psychroflexus maritimus TaxID=2714865 RepID=A0A967AEG4_9FLAO|nr:type I restriction-modification system subunit M [Psychroflexus maritimus]NGZ90804.1 type I restriction-modification system subunit M [Psychroflexus maritimus]